MIINFDDYPDDDDDRFDRWLTVNGIYGVGYETLDDGRVIAHYCRADGTEVTPENSYPYDATLTPYTKTAGRA